MALYRCPLCDGEESRLIHSVAHAPKRHLIPSTVQVSPLDFGALQVVQCSACGHLYNAAFDPDDAGPLYEQSQLTNAPVSDGMLAAVRQTADDILSSCPQARHALEIGGGSGALAAALAARGPKVTMVEPNRHLDSAGLAARGVELVTDMFPSSRVQGIFDLIICRQVLEHVPAPNEFLAQIRRHLAPHGKVYLEVPRADFILTNSALADFHLPHVQYFRTAVATRWLVRQGYGIDRTVDVKDGHDIGFFLRAGVERGAANEEQRARAGQLCDVEELGKCLTKAAAVLAALPRPIALYGATAYSQAFLGAWPAIREIDRVFDDTSGYWGRSVYGAAGTVPVMECRPDTLRNVGAVIITAYLHDQGISKKLKAHGFAGPVLTLRPRAANAAHALLPSLY